MVLEEKIEERYIEVNNITLHTMIAGSGEPLVMLHGFPDFWYGWKNIIEKLMGDYKCIVPDMRGYNLSDKPDQEEEYKLEILVEDVKQLSEIFNLEKFTLIGHDWGGTVAWAFAETYPELLKKLIILNSPHYKTFRDKIKTNKKQRKSSGYIFQMLKPGGEEAFSRNDYQLLKYTVFGTTTNENALNEEDKQKYIEAWSQPGALLGGVNYYRANRRFDDWTGIIKVPTLILFGMKDRFIRPTVLEGIEEYVGNLKIVRIENASHWIMHDAPEAVINNIREFISN